MRGHELLLEHFARIYNEGGRYDFGETRVVLLPPQTIRSMREWVTAEQDDTAAARCLAEIGHDTGTQFAAMAAELVADPLEQRRSVGSVTRLLGLVESALPRRMGEDGTDEFELHWYGSIDQDAGDESGARCSYTTGFVSGYLSALHDEAVYFVEKQCVAEGAEHCVALGRTRTGWQDHALGVRAAELHGLGVARFQRTIADLERNYILQVVDASDTREQAAEILGIGVATLFRRLKKYGVT
jgi:predicted hydrocarbon binding protein